jgi:hypothetical protein
MFTPAHWAELFTLLGVRKCAPKELLFRDFVDAGVQILASARGLKHLHGKAQGKCDTVDVWLAVWLCVCVALWLAVTLWRCDAVML